MLGLQISGVLKTMLTIASGEVFELFGHNFFLHAFSAIGMIIFCISLCTRTDLNFKLVKLLHPLLIAFFKTPLFVPVLELFALF